MADDVNAADLAEALLAGVGLLVQRARALPTDDILTMPERAALKRLDLDGPATSAELARAAQISPQSMGVTVSALTGRGFLQRDRDPGDGRRIVLSVTTDGRKLLRSKRSARNQQLATALAATFTPVERKRLMAAAPLIERLARSI